MSPSSLPLIEHVPPQRQNAAATVTVAAEFRFNQGGNAPGGIVALSPDIHTSAPRLLFQTGQRDST
jgi:hypothetical protein